MLNIPGAGSSAATMIDGFPMAQRGEGARALGASICTSTANGLIWGIIVFFFLPYYTSIIIYFGIPEMLTFIILAFTSVIFISNKYYIRGVIALCLGIFLGMIAAFTSRWVDWSMLLIFDTVRSFPILMFALAVIALFGPSVNTIIGIVVISTFPSYARLVRTQVLSLRNTEYIEAQRAMGASLPRILMRHIFPNVIGPVMIVASMDIPLVIGVEAGLSFLGLGVRPPTPSWGTILNDGFSFIRNTPWIVVSAGLPLILTTVAFTTLGERLRDILDPKLRR